MGADSDDEVPNNERKKSNPCQQVSDNTGDTESEQVEVRAAGNELSNTEGKKSSRVSWKLKSKKPIFHFRGLSFAKRK